MKDTMKKRKENDLPGAIASQNKYVSTLYHQNAL
jgi:hypothetical protein